MMTRTAPLLACLALAGCGGIADSRLNPFNWFAREADVETLLPLEATLPDPRPLVAQVSDVELDRAPGGIILRATGLPPTQGFYAIGLLEEEATEDAAVLRFQFRAQPPDSPAPAGSAASRSLTAGTFISTAALRGVRRIEVVGATNTRSRSR